MQVNRLAQPDDDNDRTSAQAACAARARLAPRDREVDARRPRRAQWPRRATGRSLYERRSRRHRWYATSAVASMSAPRPRASPLSQAARSADHRRRRGLPTSGKSVMESLPSVRGARWLVVNTMQAGDSGLMLLTSDGELADALRRRAETIPAAYVARVLVPTPEFDVDDAAARRATTTTRRSSSKASSRRAARARIAGSASNRVARTAAPPCVRCSRAAD